MQLYLSSFLLDCRSLLLPTNVNTIVLKIPLLERCSVYLNNGTLHQSLCPYKLIGKYCFLQLRAQASNRVSQSYRQTSPYGHQKWSQLNLRVDSAQQLLSSNDSSVCGLVSNGMGSD
ncbi:hypothetical protein CKAN_01609800 [Cinnamomum micranthum f. kanehirae]|uniref:Uncharacterized protein n=1 Tax=Cinnamomum micranthum f. kanehirae TaxID=337451 RepID=A0A443P8P7_9MAGN|nr:hypothetical protein CKAN_01609800 [Cinnamomum micranthum f. kanehirae]